MQKSVDIIGGGIGGLSAAIRLAGKGYHVRLYEKNESLGGKMNKYVQDGFYFDTGPSLITMPFVLEELFQYAGFNISDFIELVPINPVCRYFFEDSTVFEASSHLETMLQNMDVFNSPDGDNYVRFLKYAERIYKQTADVFVFSPIHEIKKLLRWENVTKLLFMHYIDPFHTVHQSVSKYFSDPRLIQLFDRYPTYNGSDPFRAPATLNIIPYVEFGLGAYYIKGGLYKLVDALKTIAESMNVEFHFPVTVEKILHNGRKVKGLVVECEKMESDVVLCNSDVVYTFNNLLQDFPKVTKNMNQLEPSISGMVFYWGVKGEYSQLKQHNILFSKNYETEFYQIFQELRAPDDPTIYIAVTSKRDKQHAPDGHENWFVLLNMPYLVDGQQWDLETDKMRRKILQKLKTIGIDIDNKIVTEKITTPVDINRQYSSNRGSIYGIASNTRSSAFKRPANRSRHLRGLYFAGGSSHPGGGVSLCLLSGKIAAELVCDNENGVS